MQRQVLVVFIASLFAVPALAQTAPGKTRAEVRAELLEAERTGQIAALGDAAGGLQWNEIWPARYAAAIRQQSVAGPRGEALTDEGPVATTLPESARSTGTSAVDPVGRYRYVSPYLTE